MRPTISETVGIIIAALAQIEEFRIVNCSALNRPWFAGLIGVNTFHRPIWCFARAGIATVIPFGAIGDFQF